MIILINLFLLTLLILLKKILFPSVPVNPTVSVITSLLGTFLSVFILMRFLLFCFSRQISLQHAVKIAIQLVLKKDDWIVNLKKHYFPIGIITILSSFIFNFSFSTPFLEHFFSDALVLAGYFVFLYTLQYWIVNLQGELMHLHQKS